MTGSGGDTWRLIAGKALAVFGFLVLTVLAAIRIERKVLDRMQISPGHNRVGLRGYRQPLAGGMKLAIKAGINTWLRATLPRLRYDQLMALGWKILIPVALMWMMVVAVIRNIRDGRYPHWDLMPAVTSAVVTLVLLVFLRKQFTTLNIRPSEATRPRAPVSPPGFPTPLLRGQTAVLARHASVSVSKEN